MSQQQEQIKAWQQFQRLGWPHRKLEGWQWSDFTTHHPADDLIWPTTPLIKKSDDFILETKESRMINSSSDSSDDHALKTLNYAKAQTRTQLIIPAGKKLEKPIMIEHQPGCAQLDIIVEEGAEAILFEHVKSEGFTNLLATLTLKEDARLHHIRSFDQLASAISFTDHQIHLGVGAEWNLDLIANGARRQRIDHRVHFRGCGGRARIHAALIAHQRRHCDIGVACYHEVPECMSRIQLHAILDDEAEGAARATGHIAAGATGSEIHQLAKAVILSDRARMNAKPELAIFHDNVQCDHGVAIGGLDPRALFYCAARGIDEVLARKILLEAFIMRLFSDHAITKDIATDLARRRLEVL